MPSKTFTACNVMRDQVLAVGTSGNADMPALITAVPHEQPGCNLLP